MKLHGSDALLIVDVQKDFLPGGALEVPDGDQVVAPLAAAARLFDSSDLPVIASRDWHPPDHCSFRDAGGPWPPHCVAGTTGAEFDPALSLPASTRVVDKATTADCDAYSAFDGTDLDVWLREKGVERLFVGGLATDYCVRHSAADALAKDYDVVVIEDAVRAIDDADGQRALQALRDGNAQVINSDSLLDEHG